MLLFLDKAFIIIFTLCMILSIPVSVLVFFALCSEMISELKSNDGSSDFCSILLSFTCIVGLVLIIVVALSFIVGVSCLIYHTIILLFSNKIIFFNI